MSMERDRRFSPDGTYCEAEYETTFKRRTRGKRCRWCNKIIKDGERVLVQKCSVVRSYPVKGSMVFRRWYFTHVECVAKAEEADRQMREATEKTLKEDAEYILQVLEEREAELLRKQETTGVDHTEEINAVRANVEKIKAAQQALSKKES